VNKHLVVLSYLTLATAAIATGLIGCKSRPPASRPEARPVDIIQPPALARTWKASLDLRNDRIRDLYLADDYLFVITKANYSYVFDRKSGTKVHISKINGTPKVPVVMDDFIIYPTESHLQVFNRNGRFVRRIDLGYTARTNAVTAAGRVVIGADVAGHGRVLFVDVTKPGNDVAEVMTSGALSSSPAVRGGLVFVGSEDGKVYGISEDLVAAWALPGGAFQTDGPIVADLATDTGPTANVYIASTDTKLYALSASTGEVRWQFYAGAPLNKGPTVTNDTLYIPVPGRGLTAIDKTGNESIRKAKWSIPDAVSLVADDEQFAYVRSIGNRIFGVDKKTGKIRFINDRTDFRRFAVNTQDNTIFAATPTGEIIAAQPVLQPGKMGELVMVPVETAQGETVVSMK
jgi:outer membrane protein assembly factor BamB